MKNRFKGWSAESKPKRKENPEYEIQAAFVREMNIRYPDVLVFSDTAAHIKKTMFQQIRANKLSSPKEKPPDVFIPQPSGDWCGLYLEFKSETPYLKDGVTLKKNEHNEAQAATMQRLISKGYFCRFVWTVEMAMETVRRYFDNC